MYSTFSNKALGLTCVVFLGLSCGAFCNEFEQAAIAVLKLLPEFKGKELLEMSIEDKTEVCLAVNRSKHLTSEVLNKFVLAAALYISPNSVLDTSVFDPKINDTLKCPTNSQVEYLTRNGKNPTFIETATMKFLPPFINDLKPLIGPKIKELSYTKFRVGVVTVAIQVKFIMHGYSVVLLKGE